MDGSRVVINHVTRVKEEASAQDVSGSRINDFMEYTKNKYQHKSKLDFVRVNDLEDYQLCARMRKRIEKDLLSEKQKKGNRAEVEAGDDTNSTGVGAGSAAAASATSSAAVTGSTAAPLVFELHDSKMLYLLTQNFQVENRKIIYFI